MKVVWSVVDSDLSFLKHGTSAPARTSSSTSRRTGGKTEVRFTHVGLAPEFECYDSCSNAWGLLITGNLRQLILTGKIQPDPFV